MIPALSRWSTQNHRPGVPTRNKAELGCAAVAGLGLVLTVVGTFLPWMRSGRVRRNSYASAGLLQRLLGVDGALGGVLNAWPYLGLLCALLVIGFGAGLRRTAALCTVLVGAAAVFVAVYALRASGSREVQHVATGPVVTACGAGVAVVAAVAFLVVQHATSADRSHA